MKVQDPVLGYRMSRFYPGIDDRGYRNPGHTDRTDILAVGDSMTYGFGAAADGSWPRHLARQSGRLVYNAGIGGYGPCEYRAVVNELLPLQPRVVIVAIFVGNDIADAYKSVYLDRRCADLRAQRRDTLDAIDRVNRTATLQEVARHYGEERPAEERERRWKQFALYSLLRSLNAKFVGATLDPFAAGKDGSFEGSAAKPFRHALEQPAQFRTVFMDPRRDALGVALDDPRLADGMRILLEALEQIKRAIDGRRDTHLLVLLIHNKPVVMEEVLHESAPALWSMYADLIGLEKAATSSIVEWLTQHDLPAIDTLDAMRAVVRAGVMPYSPSDDNHPNAAGYDAIAAAAWQQLSAPTRR